MNVEEFRRVMAECAPVASEIYFHLMGEPLLHPELDTFLGIAEEYGIPVDEGQRLSPKTYHAKTAAARIAREFPSFADPIIIDAVRWHTTGHAGMTLTEKLLYLAD
jgi:HD superfamily phosphohydrolase YqeK